MYGLFYIYTFKCMAFEKGDDEMKIDRKKLQIAMARACMSRNDMSEKSGVPIGTLCNMTSRGSIAPVTAGKIARALGCDVTEILLDEE
jgi:hypothetical protein